MPNADCLLWITGVALLKKWPFLDAFELAMAILYQYLPAFDPITRQFISPNMHSGWLIKDGIADKDFIEKLQFKLSDILEFESKHFGDERSMEVENIPDDQENVYEKSLKKLIDIIEQFRCEGCPIRLFAKKGLIDLKKIGPSKNESQELGRLRKEKQKWNLSLEAAVKAAIYFSREAETPVKHKDLIDFIYKKVHKSVPTTSIERIWKSFPDELKKNAGRPQKKKKPSKYTNQ